MEVRCDDVICPLTVSISMQDGGPRYGCQPSELVYHVAESCTVVFANPELVYIVKGQYSMSDVEHGRL